MSQLGLFAPAGSFSADMAYRYTLHRNWGGAPADGRLVAWVMLNPSTADDTEDDPTVRRVIGYSRAWGFAGCVVVNLFALRATDPRALWRQPDPVGGSANDRAIAVWCSEAHEVVLAWGGGHRLVLGRARAVLDILAVHGVRGPRCLGVNAAGMPRHPLYLRGSTPLQPYSEGDRAQP